LPLHILFHQDTFGLNYHAIRRCVLGWLIPPFETSGDIHPTTQSHIAEELELRRQGCENLKCSILIITVHVRLE